MGKRFTLLFCLALVNACGANTSVAQLPTAEIRLASIPPAAIEPLIVQATLAPTADDGIASGRSSAVGGPSPQPTEVISASPNANPAPSDQYYAWMIEAQALYPYPEPVQAMWEVMICESSGNPTAVTGANQGLFQYDSATWAGDWNPYRDQPILDARAQIFATAKAWHDANQHWWSCYHG